MVLLTLTYKVTRDRIHWRSKKKPVFGIRTETVKIISKIYASVNLGLDLALTMNLIGYFPGQISPNDSRGCNRMYDAPMFDYKRVINMR